MKKFINLFLCSIIAVFAFLPTCVSAQGTGEKRVFDDAGLFTASQEKELQKKIDNLKQKNSLDYVIVTTDDAKGMSAVNYLINFYNSKNIGYNGTNEGCALLIDMDNRRVETRVFGNAHLSLNESSSNTFTDNVLDRVKAKKYYKAADTYLDQVTSSLNGTVKRDRFKYFTGTEILIAILIPTILFIAIYFGVKVSYGKEGKEKPYPFKEKANINLTHKEDNFVREYLTQTTISNNDNDSGGGGSSFSSDSNSSGSGGSF